MSAQITIGRSGLCLTVEVQGACERDHQTRCRYVDYCEHTGEVVAVEPDESDDVSAWQVGTTVQLTRAEVGLAEDALLADRGPGW